MCRYFSASGSCHYGEHCAFQHVRSGPDPVMPVDSRKAPAGRGGGSWPLHLPSLSLHLHLPWLCRKDWRSRRNGGRAEGE